MENEGVPTPKQRLNPVARVMRRGRIFARLREGWAYDEIAEEERLTPERIRQIVREALERRLPDEDTDHAKLQLDRLDRYQKTAKVNQVYDDDSRKKLFEKLNRVAANLGLPVIEDPLKAKAKPAVEPAPGPEPNESKEPAAEKEKTPWGVGASP